MTFRIRGIQHDTVVDIEFKEGHLLYFTEAQKRKLQVGRDSPGYAMRLCAIVPEGERVDSALILLYWSPAFIRILPEEVWHPMIPAGYHLSLEGIEGYVSQNLENTRFALKRGRFGSEKAAYAPFPKQIAYDWFYEKWRKTVENPMEEERRWEKGR